MKYLAVLGRQPEISLAELEALFSDVRQISVNLATFSASLPDDYINRLGGSLKLAVKLTEKPLDFLRNLPEGKITLGISDYSTHASAKTAKVEALKLKKILTRHQRSLRVVENQTAILSTATSLHNGLSGKNPRKLELIKTDSAWYKVVGVQDIDAYTKRDQARPARDARVGMLPPKLAQILINLCGTLPDDARILDPFCGTGVILQEALLMGYAAYGTDINERMVEYTEKNLTWLIDSHRRVAELGGPPRSAAATWGKMRGQDPSSENDKHVPEDKIFEPLLSVSDGSERRGPRKNIFMVEPGNTFMVELGDATSFKWQPPISAIACEAYLGKPMSMIPPEIKLKTEKQSCKTIILGFLRNLSSQIQPNTPVTIAVPAWLREDGTYSRLEILDEITEMGYNVNNKSREGLIYCRKGQIVARDIIILRKN